MPENTPCQRREAVHALNGRFLDVLGKIEPGAEMVAMPE